MKDLRSCRAACVQASPVMFDKKATLIKTIELMAEAAAGGAELIVFPESYIPAYPKGLDFGMHFGGTTRDGREKWLHYYNNSVVVPGPETDAIARAASELGVYVSIGVTERCARTGSLYCSNLYFSPDSSAPAVHRKLKPTGAERCIWGEGGAEDLISVDTPFGRMGGLICWENYMPLARFAVYSQGVTVYTAPNADSTKNWQATLRHIAMESRSFVIAPNQYFTLQMYPEDMLPTGNFMENISPGGSCIIDPFGKYLAGPVYGREEILYADLNMDALCTARLDFDPAGHYNRPDIFDLRIKK